MITQIYEMETVSASIRAFAARCRVRQNGLD